MTYRKSGGFLIVALETLLNAKAEAWVAVIGVVVGAILSLFGAWLTMRSNLQQSKLKFEYENKISQGNLRRERLEELYILVCHWSNEFFSDYMALGLVMDGHQSYNEYLDDFNSRNRTHDFSRIEMIVDVYGQALSEEYQAVIVARSKINEIKHLHKSAYKRGETGAGYKKPAADAQLLLGRALDQLKLAIAENAKSI